MATLLPQAIESLQTKLRALLLSPPTSSETSSDLPAGFSAESSTQSVGNKQKFIRIEENVILPGDDHVDSLLRWLRAQPQEETPRGFFVSRDRKTAVAAVEEKFGKYFGFLLRCEAKNYTTTVKN